jgi:hypothetical protein
MEKLIYILTCCWALSVISLEAQGNLSNTQESPVRKEGLLSIMRERMRTSNVPINFFGKVVDQDGEPVAGVEVYASIRLVKEPLPGMIGDGFDTLTTVTGPDGTFSFLNKVGELLSIEKMEKRGYVGSMKIRTSNFWYYESPSKRFQPDSSTPVMFKLWKLKGGEALQVVKTSFVFNVNDGLHGVDLLKGRRPDSLQSTDFKVSMSAPVKVNAGQKYDWSFTIEGVGGGLIATDDDYMYSAPVSGYLPKIEVGFASTDPEWHAGIVGKKFYLKSRGGVVYARMELSVNRYHDLGRCFLEVEAYVNSNSSRNLECMPAR